MFLSTKLQTSFNKFKNIVSKVCSIVSAAAFINGHFNPFSGDCDNV